MVQLSSIACLKTIEIIFVMDCGIILVFSCDGC